MADVSNDINADGVGRIVPLFGRTPYREDFSRALFAVNDAGHLADALDVNLDWMQRALARGEVSEDVRQQLHESVEVCRQLTRLLGGAIGSCRAAANTTAPRPASLQLSRVVANATNRISQLADSLGVLVLSDGPSDLLVTVDAELLSTALETLLVEAIRSAPTQSVVRITSARCGQHAVVGLSSEGPGLSTHQLEELCWVNATDNSAPLTSDARRSISTLLFEQGGHIDVEARPSGGATMFIVVPAWDEAIDEPIDEPIQSGTVLAHRHDSLRAIDSVLGQKRSENMIVQSDRFGAIEVDASDVVTFPSGIIGFPRETEFLIVRKTDSQMVGWLQSTKTSYLTLPVVSAHALAARFPDVPIDEYAERAGLGSDVAELAVLAVLSAPPGQPATVNLMAPVIVNAATRTGAQVMLEGTRFTTRELFIVPASPSLDLDRMATAIPGEAEPATSAAE